MILCNGMTDKINHFPFFRKLFFFAKHQLKANPHGCPSELAWHVPWSSSHGWAQKVLEQPGMDLNAVNNLGWRLDIVQWIVLQLLKVTRRCSHFCLTLLGLMEKQLPCGKYSLALCLWLKFWFRYPEVFAHQPNQFNQTLQGQMHYAVDMMLPSWR